MGIKKPNVLFFDMSFTHKNIVERNLWSAVKSRSLNNYFHLVISVHPLAGIADYENPTYGVFNEYSIGARHILIEGTSGISPFFKLLPKVNLAVAQFFFLIKLLILAKKKKIDLVRVGDPYFSGIIGFIIKKILVIPFVLRVPSRYDNVYLATNKPVMPGLFPSRDMEKKVERFIFQHADLIAGANLDNMNYAIENGADEDKCTVFRYGNLLDKCHWVMPENRQGPSDILKSLKLENLPFLATVTRLESIKYADHILYTVHELQKKNIFMHALIIGDGSLRETLEGLAKSLEIDEYIIFAGNRTQDFIATILPHSKAILSPHMGRGLAEAALSNRPIIAYDNDWQREVIINGKTGFLVEDKNFLKMADAVVMLLSNERLSKRLAKNAREHITSMMDPQALNAHEIESYERLFDI
jgi:glycosyltransferase involved in cell wall biosynthesis